MIRAERVPLGEVLAAVDELSWREDHLYVEGPAESWTASSWAAVLALDPFEQEPAHAELDGTTMTLALSAHDIQGVTLNLLARVPSPTPEQRVAALKHYRQFDGFIDDI